MPSPISDLPDEHERRPWHELNSDVSKEVEINDDSRHSYCCFVLRTSFRIFVTMADTLS